MYYRFTSDPEVLSIDRQFLWGAAFLITPVLEQVHVAVILIVHVQVCRLTGPRLLINMMCNVHIVVPCFREQCQ